MMSDFSCFFVANFSPDPECSRKKCRKYKKTLKICKKNFKNVT